MEIVARKRCNQILEKKKKKAETESQNQGEKDGLVGIAVLYDMGSQKRGKGHNSLTGHGTVMGLVTGKVLSYATRCKSCRVCDFRKRSGKVAKNHDCRKNHAGPSKSMERDVACELWRSAPKAGVKFSTYVGDDNSTTLADIHAKVPYDVQKWSDTVHTSLQKSSLFRSHARFILGVSRERIGAGAELGRLQNFHFYFAWAKQNPIG